MNRRSFLCLFGKMVALAAVPGALLRSAPVAITVPLPEDFMFFTPKWSFWWRLIQRGLPIMYMTLAASIFWLAARV